MTSTIFILTIVLVSILSLFQCSAYSLSTPRWTITFGKRNGLTANKATGFNNLEKAPVTLPPPTPTDMEELRGIYRQMASAIEAENVELALSVVSKNIGFVFQRNIPKLTEMMLQQYPELRQSDSTLQAYYIILNAMEVLASEKKKMIQANQELLKDLILAAKVSEAQLKAFMEKNLDKLSSLDFNLYLDAEIKNANYQSQSEQLLLTIKLNILEARGAKLGLDVKALPAIAAASTEAEMRQLTLEHIAEYDKDSRELLVQSLRLNIDELHKRPNTDPLLMLNMREIERIICETIASM